MASSEIQVEWSDHSGKVTYGASGDRDVLIIVSEDVCGPEVMQRRPAIQLTEEWREKLENQGIAREHQSDDLTIVKARHSLDKRHTITGVEMSIPGGQRLTRERVLRQITTLMKNCNKEGVFLHYIGAGRRNTGDWCFEDGFITFRDLAHLYLQLLCGCVLTIVTDCSHSGSWVRECMTFLDEQGVKPCGHSARDKGIVIKVLASCLSHQVPRQLALSVFACKNDKTTGFISPTKPTIENSKIADDQHVKGIDHTMIRCGRDFIAEECLCLPEATWQTWSARNRVCIVKVEDRGMRTWDILLVEDNDNTTLKLVEAAQGEEKGKHTILYSDYGRVLKSGWGESVPEDTFKMVMDTNFPLNQKECNTGEADNFIEEMVSALEDDEKIDCKHVQSMFIGPGGSGKTSFMYRMLRKRIPSPTSTGVADQSFVINMDPPTFQPVSVQEDHTRWEKGELDITLVRQMYASTIASDSSSTDVITSYSEIANATDSKFRSKYTNQIASESQQPHNKSRTASMSPLQPPPSATHSKTSVTLASETSAEKDEFGKKALFFSKGMKKAVTMAVKKQGGYQKFLKLLKKEYYLYMRDAGGQPEFQELVTLFLFGPAIFFFVFRADLDFTKKFRVEYRRSASETINSYMSSITTEEALLQSLASVYAMGTSGKATASVKVHQPLVFIVATHKDQLGPSADQKIADLNKTIIYLIKKHGFEKLVHYADRSKHEVMFAVDNTSAGDNDYKAIRSKVHKLISSSDEFTIQYPLSYLLFCLDLHNDKHTTLTLDQCREMAAKYNIKDDQVLHLLHFLHYRIGVIQFIDIKNEQPVIMKEPQLLYNRITDLITITFISDTASIQQVDDFEKKGILTASALQSVLSSESPITPSHFLKMLSHLHIIAPIRDQEERYFIPFVLNHVPEPAGKNRETDVAPLAVKFKCKHCPKGLFGVLITRLMTRKDDDPPTFLLKDDRIFKDQVSFEVHSHGVHDEISLKYHFSHFEVNFFPERAPVCEQRDTPVKEVCNNVRQVIETAIFSALEDLHYSKANAEPVMCVRCEACSELHPVEKGDYFRIHCTRDDHSQAYRLPRNARCWFDEENEETPTDTAPTQTTSTHLTTAHHNQVVVHLTSLAPHEIIKVGVALGLSYTHLQNMNKENIADEMVNAWLRRDDNVIEVSGPPTQESLVKALESLHFNGVASKISEQSFMSKLPLVCSLNSEQRSPDLRAQYSTSTVVIIVAIAMYCILLLVDYLI